MALRASILDEYSKIKNDCCIITACDSKHAPYLFHAISSMKAVFEDHPIIKVYDLGLFYSQRKELESIHNVIVMNIENFAPHWRLNWSWKPYIVTKDLSEYNLYLDLANFVFLKDLKPWFISIKKNDYFLVSNGQHLGEITPKEYWQLLDISEDEMKGQATFGAGIIGFKVSTAAHSAIERVYELTKEGWNLGRSTGELNPNYKPSIIRNCPCFRADQTLFNISLRKAYGHSLLIRSSYRYTGREVISNYPGQYLHYVRKNVDLLHKIFETEISGGGWFWVNRTYWFFKFGSFALLKKVRKVIKGY